MLSITGGIQFKGNEALPKKFIDSVREVKLPFDPAVLKFEYSNSEFDKIKMKYENGKGKSFNRINKIWE